jgi:hypothetical protein
VRHARPDKWLTVFVSNMTNGLPFCCAIAVLFRNGATRSWPEVWLRKSGKTVCGSRGAPILNVAKQLLSG